MVEIRRLRIASAPSTVYLNGTPVVVRLRDGPRWQINVQRERARLVENRGESELKSCENPPQVSEYRVGYSSVSHGLTSHSYGPRPRKWFHYHCALISDTLSSLTGPGHRTLENTLEGVTNQYSTSVHPR